MRLWWQTLSPQGRTVAGLTCVVVGMGALGWAAVPLYDLFCRVTGYGGTTSVSEVAPDDVLDRTVKVRFDASLDRDMPWYFTPMQREMTVRIGETGLAFYEASNPTMRPVAGSATFNVTPFAAGSYFNKIACFCFEEQILQPGETVQMPVSFYVDPEIVTDAEGKFVHTITLSYTFYEIDADEVQANLPGADDETLN
ncbi:MAG: cytochrome c oxidase assembly protein [Pseudomonadota bacterium]